MNQRLPSSFFPVFTLLALTLTLPVHGQQNASPASTVLKVEGEVQKPLSLSRADLDKMPQVEVKGKDHDGREHVYKGVAVADLLRQAGATLGGQLRGKNLAQYLLVQARDGYQAVFALPETDPEFTDRVILLATAKDGSPIPDAEGPFRMVVPGEKNRPVGYAKSQP
jgi:DMSO/TMAO reductase YedYZ molybdopterin-dependent catalytic subunit